MKRSRKKSVPLQFIQSMNHKLKVADSSKLLAWERINLTTNMITIKAPLRTPDLTGQGIVVGRT